jgi:hypothetical protein
VNVAAVNDAPQGANISLNGSEDTSLIIKASDLLAGASDVDLNNLTVSSVSTIPGTTQGTLSNNGNGTWTFVPNSNFNGSTNLNFTISDGTTTVTKTLTVNVAAFNDAPTFTTTALTTAEDTALTINAANLGASDVEGGAVSVSAISVISGGGSASVTSGIGSYTPAANYNGPAVLQVSVTDGGLTTTKLVTVNVTAVNDLPTASTISMGMVQNTAMVITAAQLLSSANDIDGNTLTITAVSSTNGTITDNGNNTWTFTPNANYYGTANIQYTISDGTSSINNSATVNIDQYANNLMFNVNDNLNINSSGTYTDVNNAEAQATFDNAQTASITMQQEDVSGVSSVEANSHDAGNVTLNDFDSSTVTLGDGGSSTVNINNSTSGTVITGDGNDEVSISTANMADSTLNRFDIHTGAGNDQVTIISNNDDASFNVRGGEGDDNITLQGKYANADIYGGEGNDIVTGSYESNDTYHFGMGQGDDTFNGGGGMGWADSIMIDSSTPVLITQDSANSWTLIVDGQEATLTTDVAGTVNDNHIDFDGAATGTLTMADGSSVNFQNVDHVEW